MARARLLKPGFFKNEDLIDLPFEGRLLFAGLWTLADRSGHLEDRPKRIKMELFPADSLDVDALLEGLNAHGFIHRYTRGALALIHIPSFPKHQSPHKNEPASTVPACDCEAIGEPPIPMERSASTIQEPDGHSPAPVMSGARPAVTGSSSGNRNTEPVAVAVAVAVDADHGDAAAAAENDLRYRRISDSWMKATGSTLPPAPMERFEAYADRSSEEWVLAAIEKTGGAGIKRPAYAYSILDAWLLDGRDDEPQQDPTNPFKESRLTKQIAAAKERMG